MIFWYSMKLLVLLVAWNCRRTLIYCLVYKKLIASNAENIDVTSICRKGSMIINDYNLHITTLTEPDLPRNLGVYFDPRLTFVSHVKNSPLSLSEYWALLWEMWDFLVIDELFDVLFNRLIPIWYYSTSSVFSWNSLIIFKQFRYIY